eukprot:5074773-Prymnesium_polylepis.1
MDDDNADPRIAKAFNVFDYDGSGDLDASELADALAEMGLQTSPEEAAALLSKFAASPEGGAARTTLNVLEFGAL